MGTTFSCLFLAIFNALLVSPKLSPDFHFFFSSHSLNLSRDKHIILAVKKVPREVSRSIVQLQREIELLSKLNHPNIVQYLGSEMVQAVLLIP